MYSSGLVSKVSTYFYLPHVIRFQPSYDVSIIVLLLTICQYHRCRAPPDNLESAGQPRFRAHTEAIMDAFDPLTMWDVFGIVADVQVSPTITSSLLLC